MSGRRRPAAGDRPRGVRGTRTTMLAEALRVLALLDTPRTAAELAEAAALPLRRTYRVLGALRAAGAPVAVEETPRPQGSGRPTRRYYRAAPLAAAPAPRRRKVAP